MKQLLGMGILLMWFGYFYLYLFIGGEVIRKRRKKSFFFYQPNHTLSKDRTQFFLVFFQKWHRCFDGIMPLCNYSGICD
jgi:hypothetical protein